MKFTHAKILFLVWSLPTLLFAAADTVTPTNIKQGVRGASISIQLDSTVTFVPVTGAKVDLGAGIEIGNVTVLGPKALNVGIQEVRCLTFVGKHSFRIINPDGTEYLSAQGITVDFDPGRADVNKSGRIDGFDLAYIAIAYGSLAGMRSYNHKSDLNGDGLIDQTDLAVYFTPYFGTNQATACNTP